MQVRFEATAAGSRFVAISTYASVDAMEQLLAMGMIEGLTTALGQLEGVLADLRAWSAGTTLQRVSPTQAVIQRVVRGTIDTVWRAFHEAPLVQRWLLGPPGWTMPVCEVATAVGQTYRYGWEPEGGGAGFGFTGELLEVEAPRRAVTTEQMVGTPGPSTHNTLTLRPLPGGHTEITLTIDYPSVELADQILATGMVDGMESSYQRLEEVLAARPGPRPAPQPRSSRLRRRASAASIPARARQAANPPRFAKAACSTSSSRAGSASRKGPGSRPAATRPAVTTGSAPSWARAAALAA
jgi:uncharacterized protein YndB with AHSA1/START domain